MATFAHQFSFFFITLLFICFLSEARESKFFSKYVHLSKNTNTNYVTVPSTHHVPKKDSPMSSHVSPAPAPTPLTSHISNAPTPMGSDYGYAPAPIESEDSYYGLYAKGTAGSSLSEKNTIVDDEEEEEFSNEDWSNENHEELNYEKSNSNSNSNTYLDTNSNNLSDDNGYETSNHEVYNNNNNGYDTNVGYTSEPQGMSDTRLLHNGKFYYNVGNEKYVPSGDELSKGNNDEGGYNYGNYKKSKYEFDSMEEYEKQEGYPDVQQQFP